MSQTSLKSQAEKVDLCCSGTVVIPEQLITVPELSPVAGRPVRSVFQNESWTTELAKPTSAPTLFPELPTAPIERHLRISALLPPAAPPTALWESYTPPPLKQQSVNSPSC